MSALPKHINENTYQERTSETLENRQSDELVIAFMGAAGCGMSGVVSKFQDHLQRLGYKPIIIKLSDFISQQEVNQEINSSPSETNRLLKYQTIGNKLREKYGHEILAEYAINSIKRHEPRGNCESITINFW